MRLITITKDYQTLRLFFSLPSNTISNGEKKSNKTCVKLLIISVDVFRQMKNEHIAYYTEIGKQIKTTTTTNDKCLLYFYFLLWNVK